MGQAEGLLKEGQPGKFDHIPAAVLAGIETVEKNVHGSPSDPVDRQLFLDVFAKKD